MPAPNLNAEIQAGLKELVRIRDRVLPMKVGRAAVAHVKENFRKGGFEGDTWKDPYRKSLGFNGASSKYGTLLSGNNHLMNSNEYVPKPGRVIVRNPLDYATIQNDGGTITVTAKMKRFFWAKHMEAKGGMKHTSSGKLSRNKRNQSLSREADFWRNMALKKVGSQIRMPKRQFMGNSNELDKIIKEVITNELSNFTRNYGVHFRESR